MNQVLKGPFLVQWKDFPTGNRPYGGGGWSKGAQRPIAEPFQMVVDQIEQKGKSFLIKGWRKLKLNIYDLKTKRWIRTDYPELREQFEFHQSITKITLPIPVGMERVIKI